METPTFGYKSPCLSVNSDRMQLDILKFANVKNPTFSTTPVLTFAKLFPVSSAWHAILCSRYSTPKKWKLNYKNLYKYFLRSFNFFGATDFHENRLLLGLKITLTKDSLIS